MARLFIKIAKGIALSGMMTLSAAQADEVACVEFHGVERLFALGEAAEVAPGEATHSAAHTGVFDGHQMDGTVTWTAPPQRLCTGDEFSIRMTANNDGHKFVSGMAYVAAVSVVPTLSGIVLVACSDPPDGFGPSESSAGVDSTMAAHANTCTYRVETVTRSSQPRGLLAADLTARPSFGKVTYLYR